MSMKTDDELCGVLQEVTDGLLLMSESDYPFEVVRWQDAPAQLSPEYLRTKTGADSAARVEESDLATFFRVPAGEQEWKTETQLAEAKRFQRLRHLLEENLADIKVYRVGEVNLAVLIIGRSAEGNHVGVSTHVVET